MSSDSPGPDPGETAGLEPGGQVREGDTPPAADSMSGAAHDPGKVPNQAPPDGGGRAPMIIGLAFVALVTVAILVYAVIEIAAFF